MALSAWQATIVNESGDVIPSASIEVINEATGLTATIYANAGGGSLGNPFSAGSNGFARFYADAGSYTITARDAGSGFSEEWNNVRLGNAQGYDVGSGTGQIPRNEDLPNFGTAAEANTGTAAGEVPTNSDLPTFGTASTKDTGTATGQIPTADQLNMVGETNYTTGNLNIDTFGDLSANDDIARGNATSPTTATFYLPLNSFSAPSGISVTGTFSILNATSIITTGVSSITYGNTSNNKMLVVSCAITGGTTGENLTLRTESSTSKIVANF